MLLECTGHVDCALPRSTTAEATISFPRFEIKQERNDECPSSKQFAYEVHRLGAEMVGALNGTRPRSGPQLSSSPNSKLRSLVLNGLEQLLLRCGKFGNPLSHQRVVQML